MATEMTAEDFKSKIVAGTWLLMSHGHTNECIGWVLSENGRISLSYDKYKWYKITSYFKYPQLVLTAVAINTSNSN